MSPLWYFLPGTWCIQTIFLLLSSCPSPIPTAGLNLSQLVRHSLSCLPSCDPVGEWVWSYESTGTFPVAMLQTSLPPLAVINCLWILPYHVVCWWGQSWAGSPSCEFRSAIAISTLEDSFPNTPPLLLAFTSSSFLLWFPWAWRRWYRYPIWKWAFRNNHSSSCLPSCEVLELLLSLAKQRGALDDLVIPEGELTRTLLSIGQDNSSSFPLGLVNSLAVGFPPGFYYQTWSPSCLKSNKK